MLELLVHKCRLEQLKINNYTNNDYKQNKMKILQVIVVVVVVVVTVVADVVVAVVTLVVVCVVPVVPVVVVVVRTFVKSMGNRIPQAISNNTSNMIRMI
jgi:hypothetical protein